MVHLQAADFLAYEIAKFITDDPLHRSGQRKGRESLKIFGQKRPDMKLFTEQRMIEFCNKHGIEERIKKV